MATTTNFGWETPDDTDLVKDGALAMRTLGNAIDTSLVDLKGGTTGQVLSKTSNTDMDFTWVTSDDANAIQNAIVDAKGDLISATAADTPARLAVGTNGQVLTADSTTSTGLKWATASTGGTFTSFTPTWNGITVGNGTSTGAYTTVGDFVYGYASLTFGSTTSVTGNVNLSFPVSFSAPDEQNMTLARYRDTGVGDYSGFGVSVSSTSSIYLTVGLSNGTYLQESNVNSTTPFTWGNTDKIHVNFYYRKA
jgi:hypothetical protein